jgi:hypothetical protein
MSQDSCTALKAQFRPIKPQPEQGWRVPVASDIARHEYFFTGFRRAWLLLFID